MRFITFLIISSQERPENRGEMGRDLVGHEPVKGGLWVWESNGALLTLLEVPSSIVGLIPLHNWGHCLKMDPFWWLAASNSLQIDVGKLSLLNLNRLPRFMTLTHHDVLCWHWPDDYNLHRSLHVPFWQILYNPTDPHGRSFTTLQGMLFPNRYNAISRVYLGKRKSRTIERWTKAQIDFIG